MDSSSIKGYINSIQTLGTVDGPGVRFVVFMQGCNLRCACCHNPETWEMATCDEYSPQELFNKAIRYRSYFGDEGGVTLSGGEPILQCEFAEAFFKICKENGINTCLDTSGSLLTDKIKGLLLYTDRVLLDIKYTKNEMYEKYVGCKIDTPKKFLEYLNEKNIPTTIRQVIIPTLNDDEENIRALAEIIKNHKCIDKTELLPFKKICEMKYEKIGIPFPLSDFATPTKDEIDKLYNLLKEKIKS